MSFTLRSSAQSANYIRFPSSRTVFILQGRTYASASATAAPKANKNKYLSWPDYLTIRRSKRRWQLAATIPCIVIGFGGGAAYFGSVETDATKPIMGIDPLYAYAFATIACGGLGYLIGPIVGGAFWRMTHRANLSLIEARDREFYNHIVKNRANPAAQSATNPVPDYYGEKVGSLHQYRQWLRDQSKYRKKARWLEEE